MRITGGSWRSRALRAPKGQSTRPTSDRVREALFSMLASDGLFGSGARVLDLYAGSGALGFEALSRGASEAVMVEKARDAVAAIRDNARALDAENRVRILTGDVERLVAGTSLGDGFGIVFLDPPYADVPTPGFGVVLVGAARLVGEGGALVLEHASSDPPPAIPTMVLDRSRRHGDTTLSLYYMAAKTE